MPKNMHCALFTSQCTVYNLVNQRILPAYELVPEVHMQTFKGLVKQCGQTHVGCARENENAFGRKVSSTKVDYYDKLKQF